MECKKKTLSGLSLILGFRFYAPLKYLRYEIFKANNPRYNHPKVFSFVTSLRINIFQNENIKITTRYKNNNDVE